MNVPKAWPGILLFLTVSLRAQHADAQGPQALALRKPFFERLRRLDEQFRRFQEMTLTQLQGIAENYNISYNIDARFQQLAEQQQNLSDSLAAFQASAASDLGSLKLWTKKLQKKTEKLDLKVSELEQTLEESSRRAPGPGEGPEELGARISNVTQEIQEHRARLETIAADRDEVRGGLRELRESIGRQESRMTQLEEQVRSALEQGHASPPGPHEDELESNLTPQDQGPRAMVTVQGHESPKTSAKLQLKHSKGKKAMEGLKVHHGPFQKETEPQPDPIPYPEEEPIELWDQPQPHSQKEPTDLWDSPQSQPQEQQMEILEQPQPHAHPVQTEFWEESQAHIHEEPKEIQGQAESRPLEQPIEMWERSQPHPQEQPMDIWERSQPHPQEQPMDIWERSQPHPQEQPMGIWERSQPRPQEQPMDFWEIPHQQEDVLDVPQLPLRHKIPQHQHVSKSTGTICNVKSALIFPSTSTHNYVTFKKGFARSVHELSVCTWLKVGEGAGYIGTLLSYATEDNDNKLVLYGRNSTRRDSLDLVIGDPVYRELPVEGVLDGNWHHMCVVWSSIEGRFWHYTDRRLTSTGSRFRKGYEIPSGGAVVLGQEQDAVGGGFDEAEAFVGSLAGFAAWDRALSPGEVSEVATGRGMPSGTVLTLDDIRQPNGNVRLVHCDCLEQCP